jgi:hypothetical protein
MRYLFSGLLLSGWVGVWAASGVNAAEEFQLEPGFTLFLNVQDLTGWETKQGASLEGKTDAFDHRFQLRDGELVIDPKVKGDVIIQTTRKFAKDVHLKFDLLPSPDCNNDLFFRGIKFDINPKQLEGIRVGEWNTFEIIAKGEQAEFKSNGKTQRTAPTKAESSPLGVRAEFGSIQFRRMRVKETRE